jgi:prepilin-type N-terminal cleavage/methylation domain-containing protein
MNTSILRRPARGFTLVELLVVISIIAVLASMGFAGAQAAINKAKKTKARKICVTLDQAVLAFYDEYGRLPTLGSSSGDTELDTFKDGEGKKLLTILLGYEDSTDPENPKKIRFFEAPEAKNERDGIIYVGSGNNVEGLVDPWGETYTVKLDGDYDESLEVKNVGPKDSKLRGRRVASYTKGKKRETDNAGRADDVTSW